MKAQKRRDTAVELALRRELWRRGLRYRLQQPVADRRRRHDLVFSQACVVVDVRGCFWHSCPAHGSLPKANREWWRDKLRANRDRDDDTAQRLGEAGWLLLIVWEHDDPRDAADVIERAVRDRRSRAPIPAASRPGGK
jgi:DNA mismatch endonuclease (patch repair protein)